MSECKPRIILAADRSAGHLFPASSLLPFLKAKWTAYFFATSDYFKTQIRGQDCFFLGRELSFRNLFFELVFRFFEAVYILCRVRPDYVLGFGGRGSFFLVLLAPLFKAKTAVYEPNLKFGLANRWLKYVAGKVYTGFPLSESSSKYVYAGIPLRPDLRLRDKAEARKILGLEPDLPVLLCFGGSQGSCFINEICRRLVIEKKDSFQLIHITGQEEYYSFKLFYDKINKKQRFVKGFFRDMDILYSASDLVISRSGASTVAELSFFSLPALFLPLPGAGGHQKENACYFKPWAQVFLQEGDIYTAVSRAVDEILENPALGRDRGCKMKSLSVAVKAADFYRSVFPDN